MSTRSPSRDTRAASPVVDVAGLPNLKHPTPDCIVGGQPTPDQLAAAARAGVRRVINLRGASEDAGYDEPGRATELGLEYHALPIAGPQDLTPEKARELDALLTAADRPMTLVHCASGARVGALMALRAGWLQGQSTDDAIAIGRCWGLAPKYEPVVSRLLG
ncbi:MAG: beta-lactamase hydrolase domain-containing protein [Rhodanobacteraceae bacterium]